MLYEVITIKKHLKKNGVFCLTCFTPEGGASLTDIEVYEERSLKGGLAYTKDGLINIFETCFREIKIREMKKDQEGKLFGESFLWACEMSKKIA